MSIPIVIVIPAALRGKDRQALRISEIYFVQYALSSPPSGLGQVTFGLMKGALRLPVFDHRDKVRRERRKAAVVTGRPSVLLRGLLAVARGLTTGRASITSLSSIAGIGRFND